VTVVPTALAAGLIVPEMLQVCACAVKLIVVWDAPLTVTAWVGGVKVTPLLVGVIV
jgi:hypothetical protein